MEATPPDEPAKQKPPTPRRSKSAKVGQAQTAQQAVTASTEPIIAPSIDDEIDDEQEATRVFGAFAIGLMALLLFCILALLIAYRNIPEGL